MVNKQKILIVDDDANIAELISLYLTKECFDTMIVEDGESALRAVDTFAPNLILLDLMLPGTDGFSICRAVRAQKDIPILMVTTLGKDADKIHGLGFGADDYLTKPFLTQELLLRIQRILQRCYRGELWRTAAKTLQLGQRTVYLADALVRLPDGTAQPLTATERALLQKLAENRGHIVTYDAVCEAVWGADYYGYENSLNVHIRHLREKLEPNPSKPQYLLTVRGIGYKLAEENAQ